MDDERIVHLLEEIRDTQRQHLDAYREGLRSQRELMESQKRAVKRIRIGLLVFYFVLLGVVGLAAIWMILRVVLHS